MSVSLFSRARRSEESDPPPPPPPPPPTHGLVGPSGATDPHARLRFLLQLGAEERARTENTSMQPAIRKPRRLPGSLGPAKVEQLPRVGVGRGRLVVGVIGETDHILMHCGSLPLEMRVRNNALEGLRYALLAHLVVSTDWFVTNQPSSEAEVHALVPTAAVALEKSLAPHAEEAATGIGFGTFAEWNRNILHWFPTGHNHAFNVVRRDVPLPSTAPPGCILPEGVAAATDVQWHVIDMDLNALEQWSRSIEAKAKARFGWVFAQAAEGRRDAQSLYALEW